MSEQSVTNAKLAEGIDVKAGQAVAVVTEPPFDLKQIPVIMRAQTDDETNRGWEEGAKLLERWFNGPSGGQPPDTDIIKMQWVLCYARAKNYYKSIFDRQLYMYANDRAKTKSLQKNILKMATQNGKVKPGPFGDLPKVESALKAGNTKEIEASYVNRVDCGSSIDPLDGLKAALGRWNFFIHVEGKVEALKQPSGWKSALEDFYPDYKVTITRVGVHVSDSFDFEGWQPLGCWNAKKKVVGNVFCDGGTSVDNASFREWRKKNGKGGDFRLYSDLSITTLPAGRGVFEIEL